MPSFNGPEGVGLFRAVVLLQAVKMEKVGLKSRGGSKRRMAAIELGLKQNAKHDEVIAKLEEHIAVLKAIADMTPGAIQE